MLVVRNRNEDEENAVDRVFGPKHRTRPKALDTRLTKFESRACTICM